MTYVWLSLGWILSVFFGLLTVSMRLMNNWIHAVLLFVVVLLVVPTVSSLIRIRFGWPIHLVLRLLYTEFTEKLGVEKAYVVGASESRKKVEARHP